jgi:hypothetical protein
MQYCTMVQVSRLASEFKRDLDNGLFTQDEIDDVLDRAADEVRTILHPHYLASTIDGYDPDFPPAVNRLAVFLAARVLVESYQTSIAPPQVETMLARWDRSSQTYRNEITNAALLDATGTLVPRASGPARLSLVSSDALEEFTSGRYY